MQFIVATLLCSHFASAEILRGGSDATLADATSNCTASELSDSTISNLQKTFVIAAKYPAMGNLSSKMHFFGRELRGLGCFPNCKRSELSPAALQELRLAQVFASDDLPLGVNAATGMWTMIVDALMEPKPDADGPIGDLGSGIGGLLVAFAEAESLRGGARPVMGIEYEKNLAADSRRNLAVAACLYEALGATELATRLREKTTVVEGDALNLAATPTFSVLNAGFAVHSPPGSWISALKDSGRVGAPICRDEPFSADHLRKCHAFYETFEHQPGTNNSDASRSRDEPPNNGAKLVSTAVKHGLPVPVVFVTQPVET